MGSGQGKNYQKFTLAVVTFSKNIQSVFLEMIDEAYESTCTVEDEMT